MQQATAPQRRPHQRAGRLLAAAMLAWLALAVLGMQLGSIPAPGPGRGAPLLGFLALGVVQTLALLHHAHRHRRREALRSGPRRLRGSLWPRPARFGFLAWRVLRPALPWRLTRLFGQADRQQAPRRTGHGGRRSCRHRLSGGPLVSPPQRARCIDAATLQRLPDQAVRATLTGRRPRRGQTVQTLQVDPLP